MVYCKLKEKNADFATYDIGTIVNDMSGEVRFYKGLREPELIRQADTEKIRLGHIARIYGKYRDDFSRGDFKEKLSYEIG